MKRNHKIAVCLLPIVILAGCSLLDKDESAGIESVKASSGARIMHVDPILPVKDWQEVPAVANVDFDSMHRDNLHTSVEQIEFEIDGNHRMPVKLTNFNTGVASRPSRLAPSYPERPVPTRGDTMSSVLANIGQPANRLNGTANSQVWDYGTYRVYFKNEVVAFTEVW